MKRMSVSEVIEYLQNNESTNDFAFRGDNFTPARKFRNSRYHGDDEPEYELPGVSAIAIPAMYPEYIKDAINRARRYGRNVYLLRGTATNADEANHDPQELLMTSHRIVCMVTL